MPNWSITNITIKSKNINKLLDFKKKVEEWTSYNYLENGFGTNWLGNIVGNSGLEKTDKNHNFKRKCRGSLESIDYQNGELIINTSTAWSPMFGFWVELLNKYVGIYTLLFESFDDMGNYRITNNPDIVGKYEVFVDSNKIHDILGNDFGYSLLTKDELKEALKKLLKVKCDDFDKLVKKFESSDWSEDMSFSEWEYDDYTNYLD